MTLAKTRADRLGRMISVVFAAVLAGVLLFNMTEDPTVSTQTSEAGAEAASRPLAQPIAVTAKLVVPTTEVIAMPEPVEAVEVPGPVDSLLLAQPQANPEPEAQPEAEPDSEPAAAPAAAPESEAQPESDSAPAAAPEPVPAAATAAPNPQPAATEVPNPQPATTAVPNPQPAETVVPNPQPVAAEARPGDAPAGGTFTHTLTATVARPSLHTDPGGPVFTPTFNGVALPAVNPTVFGNPLVYRVLAGQPGDAWAKVYVPARPNGTVAWVQTSQFNWGSSNRLLQINVSDRTVTVFEGTNVLLTTSAVLGAGSSPTPLANGWVEETMAGPSSAYGPLLISLGIFSDTLNSFAGGIPKIALHGTNNPGLMGQYASNGCIRVPNDIIRQVASMMPLGSKVQIVG